MKVHFSIVRFVCLLLFVSIIGFLTPAWSTPVNGQEFNGRWSDFVNISNTLTASTYPTITNDAGGRVHVLWSEDVGGETENLLFDQFAEPMLDSRGRQINQLTGDGNTIFYTRWDGENWLEPVDIYVNSEGNSLYPVSAVDKVGNLHVAWTANSGGQNNLLYSRAPVDQAHLVRAWTEPELLTSFVLSAYYPVGIAADQQGGVHVVYSQVGTNPGAFVINSTDGGNTWSDPIELYSIFRGDRTFQGVSTMRMISDQEDRLHITWTCYDAGGNGRAIFYSQSRDLGKTWSIPTEVSRWEPGWYEVDWLNVGVLGNEIHLVWEGGSSIAATFEKISRDGGQTWSKPTSILTKIVGENGFANLVTDSANRLHLLVVKRGDPNAIAHGVWYSPYLDRQWRDPVLVGVNQDTLYSVLNGAGSAELQQIVAGKLSGNGLRYQEATIVNGNELYVAVVNEWDGEIWASRLTLDAPNIPPREASAIVNPQVTPLDSASKVTETSVPFTPTPSWLAITAPDSTNEQNPANFVLISVAPVLVIVTGLIIFLGCNSRSRSKHIGER